MICRKRLSNYNVKNRLPTFQKLGGTVELDESYFWASRKRGYYGKLKRGTQKKPIFVMIQRKVDFKATVNADS